MEFWGVEVKSGEPLKVTPGDGMLLHLSQACVGKVKKDKANESVNLFVQIDGKKLVLGTLFPDKIPQQQFDLVFDKDFELTHNWKGGSVYFHGYKVANPFEGEEENVSEGESGSSSREESRFPESGDEKPFDLKLNQVKMLRDMEFYSNTVPKTVNTPKFNSQDVCLNQLASQPTVWKYNNLGDVRSCDVRFIQGLEHMPISLQFYNSEVVTDMLFYAHWSSKGTHNLTCYRILEAGRFVQNPIEKPYQVWPRDEDSRCPRELENLDFYTWMMLDSTISCLLAAKTSEASPKHMVITTRGEKGTDVPGRVYLVNNSWGNNDDLEEQLLELFSYPKKTIWTADAHSDKGRVVFGLDKEVISLDMVTRQTEILLKSGSDVISLQYDPYEKFILYGLRNGKLGTIDTRQNPANNLRTHAVNARPSSTSKMPYANWLASLKNRNDYFLARTADGSIKLYDRRSLNEEAVMSYGSSSLEGTLTPFRVDPSERFILSGGSDRNVRLWDLNSGKVLFEERFMDKIPTALCWPRHWPRHRGVLSSGDDWHDFRGELRRGFGWGAWLGSEEGIYYMDWA